MSSLVQQIHKSNHVNHSNFDLSANVNFTTAPGMLLPVRFDDCLPNSTYKYDISVFARTLQMLVPSFARVMAHFDAFFVPYRLLGTDYQSIIVGDNRGILGNYNNGVFSDVNRHLPYLNLYSYMKPGKIGSTSASGLAWNFGNFSDSADVPYSVSTPILLNSLGYGVNSFQSVGFGAGKTFNYSLSDEGSLGSAFVAQSSSQLRRSPLPLQAYQKIYQDFYRNKLWELENKSSYFCFSQDDSVDLTASAISRGMLEMRYKDYDKDRIFGVIPDTNSVLSSGISQYASTVLADHFGLDYDSALGPAQVPNASSKFLSSNPLRSDLSKNRLADSFNAEGVAVDSSGNLFFDPSVATIRSRDEVLVQQYTALTNRRMEAFQKFAEITMMNKSDYKNQVSAHFGFTVPDINSDYCRFLGGFDVPLNISDVENNTLTNQGFLAGKGVINGNGNSFSVSPSEHGCVMIICYVTPQVDWSNVFVDRSTLRFNRYDFAIPEFDDLGFEPVRLCDVCNDFSVKSVVDSDPSMIVGYLPRYWYYKTKLDTNTTGFNSGKGLNFDAYVVSYDYSRIFDNLKKGTLYKAFKSRPSDLNNLFPVSWSKVDDNPFVFSTYISCHASLPLSVDSLPY